MKNIEKIKSVPTDGSAVVLIFGGIGHESRVSALSAFNILSEALAQEKNYIPVGIDKGGVWYIYSGEYENIKSNTWRRDSDHLCEVYARRIGGKAYLCSENFKIAVKGFFPLLHGDFGEDGSVQGALETNRLPFVGCKTLCGALSTDKASAKMLVEAMGVPTLPWVLYVGGRDNAASGGRVAFSKREAFRLASELGFPVFVKPSGLGSSIGAGVARDEDELYERISEAEREGDGRVIIEPYLSVRRELECAFVETPSGVVITPAGEADCGKDFYDFREKYESDTVRLYSIGRVSFDIQNKLMEYTRSVGALLGLRHIGRVDFFLSGGNIYFNEVNPIPGLTASSLYLKMLASAGIDSKSFLSYVDRWLEEDRV